MKYALDSESPGSGSSDKGCRCSVAVGFLLLLLAIAIAVGVGLIVHFAEKDDREVICNVNLSGLSGSQSLDGCIALASNNNEAVCSACSAKRTTSIPVTTSVAPITMTTLVRESTSANVTTATTAVTTATTTAKPMEYPIRLPGSLTPISYSVSLKPDFYSSNHSDFNFYGQSSVIVMCHMTTSEVIMHLRFVHVANNSIFVRAENSVENLFDSYEMYEPSEFIIIRTKTALMQGHKYTIEFTDFWAPLRTDLLGLYEGSWKRDGETVYHVASQMEPTFARFTFPCFDEPAMKAVFDVTISRKDHVIAISNMPVSQSVQGVDGWVHDTFQQTPIMSTYLLAFVVGKFTNTTAIYDNRFPMSIWSREEQAANRDYALNISFTLMNHFENFFGIDYSLPKEDQIAVVSFIAGAMENWGAMLYKEDYLLYEEGQSSASDKFYLTAVVSHEISHNWFGNIVSPAWWDDIWLNEAFASYMEYQGVNVVASEWKPYDVFMISAFGRGMTQDERHSSHPVFVEGLEKPYDIFSVFDAITYMKGGFLLRMLDLLVGNEVFSKALHNYIKKYSYGNARHQGLWEAIQAEADLANSSITDINGLMSTWIYQMGFPTVYVEFIEEGKLRLTQNRFLRDRTSKDLGTFKSDYGYKWNIPFTYTSSIEKKFDVPGDVLFMDYADDATVIQSDRVPSPTGDNWVIGNLQALGFLQVNYDRRNWEAIIKQLITDHTVIHPLNRYQLIHDVWSLAKSGELEMDIALRSMEYIRHEREYGPWSMLAGEWAYIQDMTNGHQAYGKFLKFMKASLAQPYDEFSMMTSSNLGLSEESAKTYVIQAACKYGVQPCVQFALSQVRTWMADPTNKPSAITPELSGVILCNAVRYGGEEEWDFMFNMYQNASLTTDRKLALAAMACTQQRWLIARFLASLFNDDLIQPSENNDAFDLMATISEEKCMLWDWFRYNYDTILKSFTVQYTTRSLYNLAKGFNTEQRLQEFEQFVLEKNLSTHPTINAAIEAVQANIMWMKDSVPLLQEWLTSSGY